MSGKGKRMGWLEQIIAMAPKAPTPLGPPPSPPADGGAGGNEQLRLIFDKMPKPPGQGGADGGAGGNGGQQGQVRPFDNTTLRATQQGGDGGGAGGNGQVRPFDNTTTPRAPQPGADSGAGGNGQVRPFDNTTTPRAPQPGADGGPGGNGQVRAFDNTTPEVPGQSADGGAGATGTAGVDEPGAPPNDPKQFTEWWQSLSPEEKQLAYARDHFIGNHPGMPWDPEKDHLGKDHYNRLHLPELVRDSQADIDRLRAQHPNWADGKRPFVMGADYALWKEQWDAANRVHEGFVKVQNTLNSPDGLPRYLGVIDDKGHAVVSINNPDTAKRTATFVPGTGQDLSRFDASAAKSDQMYWATRNADRTLQAGDVSVITWMGYDRPMNLIEAAHTSYAHGGATALDDFQAGLRASHNDAVAGGPSLNTVIGHSYGSTELGAAALGGRHLDANNVIAVGSPGALVGQAGDLNLDPGARVFATRAQNDIIGTVTGVLGPDPMSSRFGAIPFEAAPGPGWPLGLPSVGAHGSYWTDGNPALMNMGRIIAGRVDVTPPAFTP
jgi:hypothetical protein